MRLILVRHGQTSSNVAQLLDTGAPGPGLTELGREQAAALPEALGQERIDLIVTSTLLRTQETAAPLAAALGAEPWVREGVREIIAGDLEMRGDENSHRAYLEAIFDWRRDLDVRVPGGESGREFYARYDAVVAEVAATGASTAAIVSHGAAIRSWVPARSDNVSSDYAARTPVRNTGIIVLEGDPAAGWTTLTWEGQAVGGEAVESRGATAGPAGEPVGF